tara:strand:+ start:741 stop:1184 length:444 start_codon:yes stop_codon:yes gene_type:complete
MNNQDRAELKKCRNVLIQSNDPRFNFTIQKQEDIENFNNTPDIITLDAYDYSFKKDDGDGSHLPNLTPYSLYASTQSLEDMEMWYRNKYPTMPDEYHGIMARYSCGQNLTKKEVKNGVKKFKKKSKKGDSPPVGLSIVKGKFNVVFD